MMKRLLSIMLALSLIFALIAAPASAMTQQEMLERVQQMMSSPTPAPTVTPSPTEAPAAEETAAPAEDPAEGGEADAAEEESAPAAAPANASFKQGYIEVRSGLKAYRSASSKAQPAGVFKEKGYAFALRVNDTWLETAFVNSANKAMTVVYVKAADVKAVDDKAATAMLTTLRKAPKYEGFPLPTVKFGAEEVEEPPAPMDEPAPAEETVPAEEAAEEPTEEEAPTEEPAEETAACEVPEDPPETDPEADGSDETLQPAETADSAPEEGVVSNAMTVTASANTDTAADGTEIRITAAVAGASGTVTYQWQFTTNNGTSWSNTTLSGNKTATLSFSATQSRISGKQYRCQVKDGSGTVYSNEVSFTWTTSGAITARADAESAGAGDTVTIRVEADGMSGTVTYQWQFTTNNGASWSKTSLSGNKTAVLSFPATEARLSGKQYRCKVTDDKGTWYSNAVTVRWALSPVITAQADQETAGEGDTVTIRASAENTAGTVAWQWQFSTNGTSWSNTTLPGNKTAVLSFPATESRLSGKQYRCKVTDDKGTWYSNSVSVAWFVVTIISRGVCGEQAEFTLDSTGLLTVTGTGSMYNTDGDSMWKGARKAVIAEGITAIGANMFNGCSALTEITIPQSVTAVGMSAFRLCTSLKTITLPDGVTVIEPGLFYGCTGLQSVTLPANLTSIGENAFSGCTNLSQFVTPADSAVYLSLDGVLYDRDMTFLILCPQGMSGSYTIPDGVTGIAGYGSFGFSGCAGLSALSVPESLSLISPEAFAGCTALRDVYYAGTQADWDAVEIGDGNSCLTSAALHIVPSVVAAASPATAAEGDTVTFTAAVSGTAGTPSYQWQFSNTPDVGSSWKATSLTGNKSSTLTFSATETRVSGRWYRCRVTDDNGVWYSNAVCVSWSEVTAVTAAVEPALVAAGETVTFTVTLTGVSGTPSYQWQFSNTPDVESSWKATTLSGNKTSVLSFEATELRVSGRWYRCRVTDKSGIRYSNTVSAGWSQVRIIASGLCGDQAEYTLNSAGLLTITGSGDMYNLSTVPWSGVRTAVIESGITSIGGNAFKDCADLTRVTIPGTVTSIGESAFSGCTGLTGLTLPSGVTEIGGYAFSGCTGLKSMTLPSGVTAIRPSLFSDCTGLVSLTLPAGMAQIYENPFSGCTALTQINVPAANKDYASADGVLYNKEKTLLILCPQGKTGTVVIPDGVTRISGYGSYGFSGCSRLTAVKIPVSLTSIADMAFNGCQNLTDIWYAGTLEQWQAIETDDGNECLTAAALHVRPVITASAETDSASEGDVVVIRVAAEGLTGTPSYQWQYTNTPDVPSSWKATTLSGNKTDTLTFDATETRVSGRYYRCRVTDDAGVWESSAVTVSWRIAEVLSSGTCGASASWTLYDDGSLRITGTGAMDDYSDATHAPWDSGWNSVRTVIVGNGIKSIGDEAFREFISLKSVTIPQTVTRIGDRAFYSCTALSAVTIPQGVEAIGMEAFYNCALTSVSIPQSVTTILELAFGYCRSLKSVSISSGVRNIGELAFFSCVGLTSVSIPQSVTSIGEGIFQYCSNLTDISVHSGNTVYSSQDGVLYDKQKQTLLLCPEGKSGSLTIPSGVTRIAENAFSGCGKLTSVTIPSTLTEVGDSAFLNCTALTSVSFTGTQAQWDEIIIEDGNAPLTSAALSLI